MVKKKTEWGEKYRSITVQFTEKMCRCTYKEKKLFLKNSEMFYADLQNKTKIWTPPEISTCTHAAGQYALFKYMYLHSFSLIYMFI